MKTTIIPEKCVKTFDAGTWRVNLKRSAHQPGDTPTYTIDIWNGWVKPDNVMSDMDHELALAAFEAATKAVAVEIAKQALGHGDRNERSDP